MCFDLFGINILAITQYDHIFAAAGDKKIAARIEIAEVARVQPTIS